jgi:hypothetical protein
MATFYDRTKRRLSNAGAQINKAAHTNPIKRHISADAFTDMAGVSLDELTIAESARLNQSPEDIQKTRLYIKNMLDTTTRGVVHIDDEIVNRVAGFTDFELSQDSMSGAFRDAIERHVAQHFDVNIYELIEDDRLIRQHDPNFPRGYNEMHRTLVIRVHAVMLSYTALRYWWSKCITATYIVALTALAGIETYMVHYTLRYA